MLCIKRDYSTVYVTLIAHPCTLASYGSISALGSIVVELGEIVTINGPSEAQILSLSAIASPGFGIGSKAQKICSGRRAGIIRLYIMHMHWLTNCTLIFALNMNIWRCCCFISNNYPLYKSMMIVKGPNISAPYSERRDRRR